jgi:Undecaprenyl-phosphate glucose phosphotransferase
VAFSGVAVVATFVTVVAVSLLTGAIYHIGVYGAVGPYRQFMAVGALVSLLFILPFAVRGEYSVESFADGRRGVGRLLVGWAGAFGALAVIAFLTKSTATFSRGWVVLLIVVGLVTILVLERVLCDALVAGQRWERIALRRLMLIGDQTEINAFLGRLGADRPGIRVVAIVALPAGQPTESLRETLAEASSHARLTEVGEVVLLADWSREELIAACFEAFSMLPVGIHLDAGRLADRFGAPHFMRIGPAAVLALTAPPLGPLEALLKRAFDVVFAAVALVTLSPFFALVAAIIKLDSPGPVFFRQRRLGFNQREFRIWKFRSMRSLDDGAVVRQAQRDDARFTRVGRWLRRWNVDELPQLINVLRGEMSIVGPRPHAVAHDRAFEGRILRYPRRLNVKPGITGWAQVHGHRGETDTDDKMRARVEHDLYYIDNWSLWLDLYIVVMTVLSPRSWRNAY